MLDKFILINKLFNLTAWFEKKNWDVFDWSDKKRF